MTSAFNLIVNLGIVAIAGISEVPVMQVRYLMDYIRFRALQFVEQVRTNL